MTLNGGAFVVLVRGGSLKRGYLVRVCALLRLITHVTQILDAHVSGRELVQRLTCACSPSVMLCNKY